MGEPWPKVRSHRRWSRACSAALPIVSGWKKNWRISMRPPTGRPSGDSPTGCRNWPTNCNSARLQQQTFVGLARHNRGPCLAPLGDRRPGVECQFAPQFSLVRRVGRVARIAVLDQNRADLLFEKVQVLGLGRRQRDGEQAQRHTGQRNSSQQLSQRHQHTQRQGLFAPTFGSSLTPAVRRKFPNGQLPVVYGKTRPRGHSAAGFTRPGRRSGHTLRWCSRPV